LITCLVIVWVLVLRCTTVPCLLHTLRYVYVYRLLFSLVVYWLVRFGCCWLVVRLVLLLFGSTVVAVRLGSFPGFSVTRSCGFRCLRSLVAVWFRVGLVDTIFPVVVTFHGVFGLRARTRTFAHTYARSRCVHPICFDFAFLVLFCVRLVAFAVNRLVGLRVYVLLFAVPVDLRGYRYLPTFTFAGWIVVVRSLRFRWIYVGLRLRCYIYVGFFVTLFVGSRLRLRCSFVYVALLRSVTLDCRSTTLLFRWFGSFVRWLHLFTLRWLRSALIWFGFVTFTVGFSLRRCYGSFVYSCYPLFCCSVRYVPLLIC